MAIMLTQFTHIVAMQPQSIVITKHGNKALCKWIVYHYLLIYYSLGLLALLSTANWLHEVCWMLCVCVCVCCDAFCTFKFPMEKFQFFSIFTFNLHFEKKNKKTFTCGACMAIKTLSNNPEHSTTNK